MVTPNANTDVQQAQEVIDPQALLSLDAVQTSRLEVTDTGDADRDGFDFAVEVSANEVQDQINIVVVIDTSGSTRNDSGSDFTGDGNNETILEAELIAARALFLAYVSQGYDPSTTTISIVSYANSGQDRGTFALDDLAGFEQAIEEIANDGPDGGTNFVEGLETTGDVLRAIPDSPDATNVVVFLSDGDPDTSDSQNAAASAALDTEFGAFVEGIAVGSGSNLSAMQAIDNTATGAQQVTDVADLLAVIVQPLTAADFLRFEITVEGIDENGDPLTQTLVFPDGDPLVVTSQLSISIPHLEIDEQFQVGSELTVTARSFWGEDPGNPGSGEQVITTQHVLDVVVCFTPGTMIRTPQGARAIEDLSPGDAVITRDEGVQRIAWIGATRLPQRHAAANPMLHPVLICKDAFGPDQPDRDMRVSRQHRILVRGWRAEMLFGEPDGVLVPAAALLNGTTVVEDRPTDAVIYIHMAFERHQVVYADGIEAESFHPTARTVAGLSQTQRDELTALFPELREEGAFAFHAARPELRMRDGGALR